MGNATTWTFDADDSVYKNNALSGKLLEQAARNFVFAQFTDKVDGYGKGKGESVTIVHYKPLDVPSNNGLLDEATRIPIDKAEMGSRVISIKEWGRGVEYTRLNEQLAKWDPKQPIQKLLTRQMTHCMDNASAAAFKEAKVLYIPTSISGGTWDTDGTASTAATVNLSRDHLAAIRDYMVNDLHVPPYENSNFVGLFTTKALRGLKGDKGVEEWHKYLAKGDFLFNSEIGMIESVRLVEVNNESALSNSVGTGNVLGEGVVFGDEAVSRIEVDFPHLRADPNFSGDFGRTKAVAWYGTVNYGITWDTANDEEARVVYITSS